MCAAPFILLYVATVITSTKEGLCSLASVCSILWGYLVCIFLRNLMESWAWLVFGTDLDPAEDLFLKIFLNITRWWKYSKKKKHPIFSWTTAFNTWETFGSFIPSLSITQCIFRPKTTEQIKNVIFYLYLSIIKYDRDLCCISFTHFLSSLYCLYKV